MANGVVIPFWQSGDAGPLVNSLAADATFSSPAADYHGRARTVHMLTLIATVLERVDQTGRWSSERDGVHAFTARVDDHELQGMVRETYSEDGRLEHITLYLRPYRSLRAAMAKMAQRMEVSPLPEQSA
ncbi:hypothetical protein HLB23_16375 [Nocardia uniformis]|uniref:SnoaL-like domain-containing protein n=1 Tax=Nocardia uniformis TaxID=53432 RepID=A0A849C4R3_9NOCA|nr:hypothetical protein [Nocardia uniformis]NNH71420.1 hypothetical protein [Nocardia uniformis]